MTEEVLWVHDCPSGSYLEIEIDGNATTTCLSDAPYVQSVTCLVSIQDEKHLWNFAGNANDSAGGVDLDCPIDTWISGGGLRISEPTILTGGVIKLAPLTLAVWVTPEKNQWSRVFSLSEGKTNINLELRQVSADYSMRCRGEADGSPSLSTTGGLAVPQLTYIVYTLDEFGNDGLWINAWKSGGSKRSLGEWGEYSLYVANSAEGDRPWLGDLHKIALYDRVLSEQEIAEKYAEGPHGSSRSFADMLRDRAYGEIGTRRVILRNDEGALLKYARWNAMGAPLTSEFTIIFGGLSYVCQGFSSGIVYCEFGDWGNIEETEW